MASMRCTCVCQDFQEDMGLSENTLIMPSDQISFSLVIFPEIKSTQAAVNYRIFLRQEHQIAPESKIIELKNSSLTIDSSTLRQLKQSIAVLVWKQLGRIYKDIDVRGLPLLDSFSLHRTIFGNIFQQHVLEYDTFECSASDYLDEFYIKQTYQTTKRINERSEPVDNYIQVMAMPRTQFQAGSQARLQAASQAVSQAGLQSASQAQHAREARDVQRERQIRRDAQCEIATIKSNNRRHQKSRKSLQYEQQDIIPRPPEFAMNFQAVNQVRDLPLFSAESAGMLAAGVDRYESEACEQTYRSDGEISTLFSPVKEQSFTLQSVHSTPQHGVNNSSTNSSFSTPGSKRVRQISMWDEEPWEDEESIMRFLRGGEAAEGMQAEEGIAGIGGFGVMAGILGIEGVQGVEPL